MGICKYCGEPAGVLRHEHKACRERHDEIETKIIGFFGAALSSPMPATRFHELTEELAHSGFIRGDDFHGLVLRGFSELIDRALDDRLMTEQEEDRIDALTKAFGLKIDDIVDKDVGHRLAKAVLLRHLGEGKLPASALPRVEGNNPINLQKGEVVIWAFNNVTFFTPRVRTQYVGSSHGVSFRVMRGVYYRVGAFKGAPVKTQYLSNEGTGSFVITNLNAYFLSSSKTLKIPARKIVSIEPHSDGITINCDGANAKPLIFTLDDPWFAANALGQLNHLEN